MSRRTGKNHFNMAPLPESMVMQLQTDSDTNTVSGSCAYDWGAGLGNPNGNVSGGGVREQVGGTIAPDGSVVFYHTCFSEGGVQDRYQYSESGKSAILQSVTPNAWIPWMLAGTASGNVETKYYEYSFSPDVQITRSNQGLRVLAGRYEIGEVTNLRLVTETEASANFAWHAQLNQLGGILLEGAGIPTGTGAAEFAKKPDGSWVIVKLSF